MAQTHLTCEIRTVTGDSLGLLILAEKSFKTGSVGYHGQGKIEIDGERYQCQVQMVKIGSKAAADSDKE